MQHNTVIKNMFSPIRSEFTVLAPPLTAYVNAQMLNFSESWFLF